MTIYYAHHLWKYDTPIESYEIELIRKTFPEATIINPNAEIKQDLDEAAIMSGCIETVKRCDAVVFSSVSGVIGKGVFDEIASARETYYIKNNAVSPFAGNLETILNSTTDRIFAVVVE